MENSPLILEEREELYEAFFESNWDLLTSAKQI